MKWKRKLSFEKNGDNKSSKQALKKENVKVIKYKRRGRVCIPSKSLNRNTINLCETCSDQKNKILQNELLREIHIYEDMNKVQNNVKDSSEYIYADFISWPKEEWIRPCIVFISEKSLALNFINSKTKEYRLSQIWQIWFNLDSMFSFKDVFSSKCMKLINKKLIDAGKVFFLSDIVQYLPLWFNSEIRIFVSGPLTDFSIININMAFHIHLYIVRAGQGLMITAYDAQPGCLQTRCCLHTNNYHSSDL